jgi:hypothetical protein
VPAEGFGALDRVAINGSTPMTGNLTLSGNPTANLHAVPQQWVNAGFAGVVIWNGTSWPSRPSGPGVVLWIGATTTQPPVGGAGGAQTNDVWLQNTL